MRPPEELELYERVLAQIRDDPATLKDLIQALQVPAAHIRAQIRIAKRNRDIHIGRWEKIEARIRPLYYIGKGRDAPRPPRLTPAQRSRLYRQRLKDRDTRARYGWLYAADRHGSDRHRPAPV